MNNPGINERGKLFLIILTVFFFLFTGCASFSSNPEKAPEELFGGGEWEKKGTVELSSRGWNWFFRQAEEISPQEIENTLLEKARKEFGEEARIMPDFRHDSWNPRSLLMLLNAMGWVSDTSAGASVWLPVPPKAPPAPVPEKPVRKRIIRKDYRVVPDEEYVISSEFTKVAYRPAEAIHSILKMKLDMREITGEEWLERSDRVPAGGRILISLGRTDLENAISKWFRYILFDGENRLFLRRGREDIPYVPGSDKLWWNDVSLDIKQEWTGPMRFTIEDEYQEKIYGYTIIREEYVEEIEIQNR